MPQLAPPVALFSPEYFRDPYPVFDWLREHSPIHGFAFPVGDVPMWFVTRYEDVRTVLTDPRFSSSEKWASDEFRAAGLSITGDSDLSQGLTILDPPQHTRVRRCAMSAFTPRRVEQWRENVVEVAEHVIADWRPGRRVDLMADYAVPVPSEVIGNQLGYDIERRKKVIADNELMFTTDPELVAGIPAAAERLCSYGRELIEEKRVTPGDDLTSLFIQARDEGERLTESELVAMVTLTVMAGVGSTKGLIGNSLRALLAHPDQLRLVAEAPGLLDGGPAIEELLRYCTPNSSALWRFTTEPLELAGVSLPAGAPVMAMLISANRDPEVFADPNRLDLRRTGARHFGLGHGIHNCLGAAVARLVTGVALSTLITRFPGMRPAVPDAELRPSEVWVVNGVRELPVIL